MSFKIQCTNFVTTDCLTRSISAVSGGALTGCGITGSGNAMSPLELLREDVDKLTLVIR